MPWVRMRPEKGSSQRNCTPMVLPPGSRSPQLATVGQGQPQGSRAQEPPGLRFLLLLPSPWCWPPGGLLGCQGQSPSPARHTHLLSCQITAQEWPSPPHRPGKSVLTPRGAFRVCGSVHTSDPCQWFWTSSLATVPHLQGRYCAQARELGVKLGLLSPPTPYTGGL